MKALALEIKTVRAKETQKWGQILAEKIIKKKIENRQALAIGLIGELGSGKTTFIQGFAQGLKIKEKITSPTFVILKRFKLETNSSFEYLYHIDCYRLDSSGDLLDLGFREIISRPENLLIIEWAERVKKILPSDTVWIKFEHLGQNKRKIIIDLGKSFSFENGLLK